MHPYGDDSSDEAWNMELTVDIRSDVACSTRVPNRRHLISSLMTNASTCRQADCAPAIRHASRTSSDMAAPIGFWHAGPNPESTFVS